MQADISSQRTERELVTDLGIFSMDVTSLDADSDSAVMTVDVEYWTKYIKERDSGFDVLFPVTKDTLEVSFVCKDGKWLISNQKLVNHLFDGDKDAERHTETYDEALQYAKNTTPVNIFSK